MKKTYISLFITALLIFSFCDCGNSNASDDYLVTITPESIPAKEVSTESSETIPISEEGQKTNDFSFEAFKNLQFTFSSGAGGWATLMTIEEDGSFSGEYFDGELGSSGPDYPNGTTYQSNFFGTFTQPIKMNDYTYSVQIKEIGYDQEPGTEEIIDGMLYSYGKPYGIEGAEEILIYLPGAPLDQLPEAFLNWVRSDWTDKYHLSDYTELPFYGLYNKAQECGFSSYDMIEYLDTYINSVEDLAADYEEALKNDPLTQLELNENSYNLYSVWDIALNYVWDIVKKTCTEEKLENILNEQREWISMKEQAVTEAGAELEGGSMQSMVMNQKAAELTKERVYELVEILK